MSEILIEAKNIEKSYTIGDRSLPIIRGISLQIRSSEVLGLLGASGAGKSTLLHILGLLDEPSSGEVLFQGRPTAALTAQERASIRNQSIGFVFQFYHLIPELSAVQNVLLPRMIGFSFSEWKKRKVEETERATKLLTRFGLGHRLEHRPAELSGGERQRVAIARALMPKPAVVLCDEPTGNLDSKTGTEILDILGEVHREEKTTFVIVTHDDRVAKRCSRVIHLEDGKVAGG